MTKIYRREALQAHSVTTRGDVSMGAPRWITWWVRATLVLTLMLAVFVLSASYTSRHTVSGITAAGAGMIRVTSAKPGRVTSVNADAGTRVQAGDLLFTLEANVGTQASDLARARNMQSRLAHLQLQYEQGKALDATSGRRLEAELTNERRRLSALKQQHLDAAARHELSVRRREILVLAIQRGLIGRDYFLQAEAGWIGARMAAREARLQMAAAEQRVASLRLDQETLQKEAAGRRTSELARIDQAAATLEEVRQIHHVAIRAPVAGRVTSVSANAGQSVNPGQLLASLQPAGAALQARLLVPTRAAGQLAEGQTVWLRFAAFPHRRYGLHPARISSVTSALVEVEDLPPGMPLTEPSYWVTATLGRHWIAREGRRIQLRPGMTLNAELVTDRGLIYQWLLRPLRQKTA